MNALPSIFVGESESHVPSGEYKAEGSRLGVSYYNNAQADWFIVVDDNRAALTPSKDIAIFTRGEVAEDFSRWREQNPDAPAPVHTYNRLRAKNRDRALVG